MQVDRSHKQHLTEIYYLQTQMVERNCMQEKNLQRFQNLAVMLYRATCSCTCRFFSHCLKCTDSKLTARFLKGHELMAIFSTALQFFFSNHHITSHKGIFNSPSAVCCSESEWFESLAIYL